MQHAARSLVMEFPSSLYCGDAALFCRVIRSRPNSCSDLSLPQPHFGILTRVTSLAKLLASTKSPSLVTEVLRTMLPPPGIAQLWNFAVLGSKRTTVFGVDSDSLYQMMSLIAEMP